MAESARYVADAAPPTRRSTVSPNPNSTGTLTAPSPITSSASPYNTAGRIPNRSESAGPNRPASSEPAPSPSMNTDTTTETTGVMMPKCAKASRSHTTW